METNLQTNGIFSVFTLKKTGNSINFFFFYFLLIAVHLDSFHRFNLDSIYRFNSPYSYDISIYYVTPIIVHIYHYLSEN